MDKEYVKYNFTNDIIFKASLEKCPKGAIALIKEFVPDLKDLDINEEVTFLKQENNFGIDITSTIFDVNLLIANNLIELEMQIKDTYYNIKSRMLKYYVDLLNSSFSRKDNTNKYSYKPTYSVWFLGFKLFEDEDYIREYKLYDDKHNNTLLDDTKIIIVEFAKFLEYGYNKNRWYDLFLTHDLNKLRGEAIMDDLVDSIKALNNDDTIILEIDAKKRAEDERISNFVCGMEKATKEGLEKGMQQGLEQGMQQGIQQGMQQGLKEGLAKGLEQGMQQGLEQGKELGEKLGKELGQKEKALSIAKNLKAKGMEVSLISEVTGLSMEEIELL